LPQLPQFAELPDVSTHELPHGVSSPAHPVAHLLCEHTIPDAQELPHAPQFFASEVVSAHAPEQLV
jgi:hypothetical protein